MFETQGKRPSLGGAALDVGRQEPPSGRPASRRVPIQPAAVHTRALRNVGSDRLFSHRIGAISSLEEWPAGAARPRGLAYLELTARPREAAGNVG